MNGKLKHLLISALIVLAILTSLVPITTQQVNAQSTVNAVTYDEWLAPCKCYGGSLKVALSGEPNTLNWFVAGASVELTILEPIYDRLVRIINGTLTWELATSMQYSPDYKTLTIKIRQGVKWHDGLELTAEDVAFTINVLTNKTWTYSHGYYVNVDKAVAVDKYTVNVYFKAPDAGFIYTALASMNVMPKHIWEPLLKEKGDELAKYSPKATELIGSGPFKFVEYVPGQHVKYVVNKDYWLGRPCIDEITIVFISEASVQILALQRGDVDTLSVSFITPEVVPQLLATPNVGVHTYTSQFFYHWGLNNLMWPTNISDFRKALALAVNREAIVRDVLMGYGLVGSPGVVPPIGFGAEWYNPNVADKWKYDPNKAAEILDSLGFKDVNGDGWREGPNGQPVEIEVYAPSYDIVRVRIAQILAEQLSKIPGGGIKIIPRAADWTAVWPNIREGKVQSWLLGSSVDPDISWLHYRFHSRPDGAGNWARFSDPEVDKLTEELKVTFDPDKRKEIAWKIQEILADKVPVITLYYRQFPVPYRTDKFDNWFRPADDEVYNRVTYLRLSLKLEKCPTTPATSVVTTVVTQVTQTQLVTTVTQPPTTVVTTVVTTAGELPTLAIVAAVVIIVVIGSVAFIALRRR